MYEVKKNNQKKSLVMPGTQMMMYIFLISYWNSMSFTSILVVAGYQGKSIPPVCSPCMLALAPHLPHYSFAAGLLVSWCKLAEAGKSAK